MALKSSEVLNASASSTEQTRRSLPDDLSRWEVKLSICGSVQDPTVPVGTLLFNVLAMVADFESDLIRACTRMLAAKAAGGPGAAAPGANGP